MDLAGAAGALDASAFGAWVRGSAVAYPATNVLHVLGVVMLVGGIGVLDLRLIGFARRAACAACAIAAAHRHCRPRPAGGERLVSVRGRRRQAVPLNRVPQGDGCSVLAIANAVIFEVLWGYRFARWSVRVPPVAVAMAVASLGLWLVIAMLGRLIAYF